MHCLPSRTLICFGFRVEVLVEDAIEWQCRLLIFAPRLRCRGWPSRIKIFENVTGSWVDSTGCSPLDTHNMFTRATGHVTFNRSTNKHFFPHPEIELRPSVFGSLQGISKASTKTILDLLEVYPDHVNWKERLGHSSLLKCFQVCNL
jgi:hypothetical protein